MPFLPPQSFICDQCKQTRTSGAITLSHGTSSTLVFCDGFCASDYLKDNKLESPKVTPTPTIFGQQTIGFGQFGNIERERGVKL